MYTGRMSCEMKAAIKVMYLQAKQHHRLPAKPQKLGERHRADSPSWPSEGINLTNTLILDFWPPEL